MEPKISSPSGGRSGKHVIARGNINNQMAAVVYQPSINSPQATLQSPQNQVQNHRSRSYKQQNKGLSPKQTQFGSDFKAEPPQNWVRIESNVTSRALEFGGVSGSLTQASASTNILPVVQQVDSQMFSRNTPTQSKQILSLKRSRGYGQQQFEQTQRVSHLQLTTLGNTSSQLQRGFAVTTSNVVDIGKTVFDTMISPKEQNSASQETHQRSKINFALAKVIQGIGAAQSSSVGPVHKIRGGVVLQDNHRRRLQALAQVQHQQSAANSNSNDSRGTQGQISITNVSNQSGNGRLKIINKKLITFTQKNSTILKQKNNHDSQGSLAYSSKFQPKNAYISNNQSLNSGNEFVTDKLVIREEVSPGRFAPFSNQIAERKVSKSIGSQNVALGYRRHQVIQDITEDISPNNANTALQTQRPLLNQNSNTSLQSQKVQTQVVDLANLFYGQPTKLSSGESIKPFGSLIRTSQQQLQTVQPTYSKKPAIPLATSRDRTIKKKPDQLTNQNSDPQLDSNWAMGSSIEQQQQPRVGQRRPLVLRKNNFIQTSQHLAGSTHNSQPPRLKQPQINLLNISQIVQNISQDKLNITQPIQNGAFATAEESQTTARNKQEKLFSGQKKSYASNVDLDLNKLSREHESTNSLDKGLKDSRMFKVNRSKKKLETARRSRIQQIQETITNPLSLVETSSKAVENIKFSASKYESNQIPIRTPLHKEQPKPTARFDLAKQRASAQKLQIVMPSATITNQEHNTEPHTHTHQNHPVRILNYNTTIAQDIIHAGTTKNINGNSLPQTSNKTFRRGQIFRQQNKKNNNNSNQTQEAPREKSQEASQRPTSRKRIVFQGEKGENSLGELTPLETQKSSKPAELQERVTSSQFDQTISEILGEVATKSVINDVKKNLKKDSVPKVLVHENFVPKVLNHERQIQEFITIEAKEVEIECVNKGQKTQIWSDNLTSPFPISEKPDSDCNPNSIPQSSQQTEDIQQAIILPEFPFTLPERLITEGKNNHKVEETFCRTNTEKFKTNIDQSSKQSKQDEMLSVTKGIEQARDALTQTADTSNRKTTISNNRNYCNSSDIHFQRAMGTTFSLNSHTSPEGPIEIPKFPMSAQTALKWFGLMLTDYEKTEILDYPMVYFLGSARDQKINGNENNEFNSGYDDDKGDYKVVNDDHIGYRYEVKSFLGKGSFGTALKCIDHKTGKEIAMKIIKNKKKYYYQAGVELKILQFLKDNDPEDIMNVIHLNDYVIFRKHLCIGFELMSMNLFEFLKINDFNGFDHNLIRRFAIQLLYALKYLKMFQIIHCDLKPENILLKEPNKSGIKIIDFGSSTFMDERVYTYIQSRFYRAPEIMLGIPYNCAIDMWSFGCIMAELYIGYPIFPGDSENDQMSRIIEMVGIPGADLLSISGRKDKFFVTGPDGKKLEPVMAKNSRGKLRKPLGKPIALVIGDEDPDFTDFVQKCLEWNPAKRITPDNALKHVWVLKGLPPQVLIHHQKMHNILTPELPSNVLQIRNDYMSEQVALKKQEERFGSMSSGRTTNRGPGSNPLTIQLPNQTQIVPPHITPTNQTAQNRGFHQQATQQMNTTQHTKGSSSHQKQKQQNYPGSTKAQSQGKALNSSKQQLNLFKGVNKKQEQISDPKTKRFHIKNLQKN